MSDYSLYTDGACSGNPGPGGWGAILLKSDDTTYSLELCGNELNTTNNRMELTAVIRGLAAVPSPKAVVHVITDSQYIVNAINKGWLNSWISRDWRKSDGKPVLNDDLWKALHKWLCIHSVTFEWVKGHADNPYNNKCDELARTSISKLRSIYG